MASNKKIKADNEIEVEATNINLEATTDVTGDLNVSSNLNVTGTINSFNLPSSDGTDGQIIKTDGSGNLSFIDAASGGGADEITSQSDATNYTGTARVIYVSASGTITFSSDLRDRIIISSDGSNGNTIKFSNCNVIGCTIRGYTNVFFECTSVTNMLVWANDIHAQNSVTLNNAGASSGNNIMFRFNRVTAGEDLKLLNWNNNTLDSQKNVINVYRIYTSGTVATHMNSTYDRISCAQIFGSFLLDNTSIIASEGSTQYETIKITIGSTVHVDSVLDNPFTVDGSGLNSKVILIASTDAGQTISNFSNTIVVYEDKETDNTSSYSTNGVFTAPIKGTYAVHGRIMFSSNASFDVGEYLYTSIEVNGTLKAKGDQTESVVSNTQSVFYSSNLSAIVNLDRLDTVVFKVFQNSGTSRALNTYSVDNTLHIHKIN